MEDPWWKTPLPFTISLMTRRATEHLALPLSTVTRTTTLDASTDPPFAVTVPQETVAKLWLVIEPNMHSPAMASASHQIRICEGRERDMGKP